MHVFGQWERKIIQPSSCEAAGPEADDDGADVNDGDGLDDDGADGVDDDFAIVYGDDDDGVV